MTQNTLRVGGVWLCYEHRRIWRLQLSDVAPSVQAAQTVYDDQVNFVCILKYVSSLSRKRKIIFWFLGEIQSSHWIDCAKILSHSQSRNAFSANVSFLDALQNYLTFIVRIAIEAIAVFYSII